MLSFLARASCSRSPAQLRLTSSFAALPRRLLARAAPSCKPATLHLLRPLTTTPRRLRPTWPLPPSASVPPSGGSDTPGLRHELVHLHDPPAAPNTPPLGTILDKYLPRWADGAKPYLLLTRFDKPIGSALLFWPCAWSITMASSVLHLPPSVPAFYIPLFALGAVIMRGAGCTVNDMWDSKYDAAVERTKNRPIARGDVSQFQALTFLGVQLAAGLAVLTQLNMYSILLGASSLGLVVLYPFMKRITYYPQIVFGMTFSWGTLLGWSAVAGSVNWTICAPMYIAKVAWGVMYDTIYAHQDKDDDILVGVKSTALAFPHTSRPFISALAASFISLMTLTGHLAGLGPLYYLISCGGGGAHLAWQCATVDFDDRQDCWRKFVSNGWLGGIIWLGIAADYVARVVLGQGEEQAQAQAQVTQVADA